MILLAQLVFYFAALAVSLINIPPINAALGATRTWHNVASWLIR